MMSGAAEMRLGLVAVCGQTHDGREFLQTGFRRASPLREYYWWWEYRWRTRFAMLIQAENVSCTMVGPLSVEQIRSLVQR